MRRPQETTAKGATARKGASPGAAARTDAHDAAETAADGEALKHEILKWLDDAKAEDVVALDIRGKTSIGDCMIVATGRSDRHVGAIADQLQRNLKDYGVANVRIEGQQTCDWVLVDVGATIIHLFRPEVREFYNLEKMWSGERPGERPAESTH